jgi:hypothetical protein
MANRWKGNLVANAATSSGTAYTGKADGAWGLNSQLQQKQANLWAASIGFPSTPIIGTVTTGASTQLIVNFTPSSTGGGTVIYTATSTPSGITGTSTGSPITVSGLTNGTLYTFTVRATNSYGYSSAESASSNSRAPDLGINTVAMVNTVSPYILVYPWTSASGFGTKATNPTTLPAGACYGASFNTTSTLLAISGANSPYINVYNITSGVSFGTRYTNPSVLPSGQLSAVTFDYPSTAIISSGSSSSLVAYAWSNGFGSKFADPSSFPVFSCNDITVNNANSVVFLADYQQTVYNWSNGFGSKFAFPSAAVDTSVNGLSLSDSNNLIAYGISGSPQIAVYNWDNSSGFGSKYADPATLPPGTGGKVDFSPGDSAIAIAHYTSPYLSVYAWSNGFGSKYSNPSTLPIANGRAISFTKGSDGIIVAADTISGYRWNSSTGFGTKYADPSSQTTSCYKITFTK